MNTPPILPPKLEVTKPRRKGHQKLIIFSVLVVVVLGVAMFFALHRKEVIVTVQTEKVGRHTITETVIANGKIYPVLQVHISAEVSGEIIELRVKEGQFVHRGDLLLKINPKTPLAYLNQSKASYEASRASVTTSAANLEKAEAEFKRNKELFDRKLISDSDFINFKVGLDIARAQLESAGHSVELAKASVDSAQDSLDKTTIEAPLDGTITKLNSQLGERVLGTVQNAGTEIMTISDLSQMEARVDIGEMDIVLLKPGQKAKLEVDSFKDKKFAGAVTDVANSSEGLNTSALAASSSSATQFQVRIRLLEGDQFRPGMSVSAEIETRTRTNTLAVPFASVTTRILKKKNEGGKTNSVATNALVVAKNENGTNQPDKKLDEKQKPVEVVFVVNGNHVNTVPVKTGILDDNFYEILEGVKEGDEIVTGNNHAINKDLDDDKKIVKGAATAEVANAK